jgi:5'/3'-nucleotidase
MIKKPFILITNDDGIFAPGIKHLWNALIDKADLAIIAPAFEQSGVGLKVTLRDPLHIEEVPWENQTPAWKVTGTPADCVRLGLSVILKRRPDLIVSGINRGANSGRVVLYSGTAGGAIEGTFRDIPAIAFSCSNFENPNYALTEKYIFSFVSYLSSHPLPKGTFLNVNFPLDEIKGFKFARQGSSYFVEDPEMRLHPDGYAYYWLSTKWTDEEEAENSDSRWLKEGYATAVPIHVAELTDHAHLKQHKESFETLFNSRF